MKAKGSDSANGKLTPEEIKQRNLELYGSRIKAFRTRAGLSAQALADALKISKSSIRNWECGLTRPDPEFLYRMFSILDVEPNEFFGIRKAGISLSPQEKDLLQSFRELDGRSRQDLTAFAETLSNRAYMRKLNRAYHSIAQAPDYGRSAAAGEIGADWPDRGETERIILFAGSSVAQADEVITVSGESMEPQFHHNDKVLVKYCSEIRNGDIGIFYVPGVGGVIKQKSYDRLHSINPDYDDIFPYEDGARLIGRVLCRVEESMKPDQKQIRLYLEAEKERAKDPSAFDAFDEDD